MISSIDKLENLGIYNTIPPKTASDFKRYNLIYGWNGSGKSTLSRLFGFIGGRNIPPEYDKLKLSITVDGIRYSEKQIPLTSENISVFNEDFIKDNIDWNGTLKSILLLDEKNIEEVKRHTALKEELYGNDKSSLGLIKQLADKQIALDRANNELQRILTNIGKTVKNNYQLLDTHDTYYLNYDKRKVLSLLEDKTSPLSELDLLKPTDLEKAIKEAKPVKKEKIVANIAFVDISLLKTLIGKTHEIVLRKVASKVISELRDNQELAVWVESGMKLHKSANRNVCAFCGGTIGIERYKDLEAHFSNALNKLNADIESCIGSWRACKIEEQPVYSNHTLYYDEYIDDIKKDNEDYTKSMGLFYNEIDVYIQLLEEKRNKPFDNIDFDIKAEQIMECANSINNILMKYEMIIAAHNKKTETFEEATKVVKKRVERHYVQEQVKNLDYNDKLHAYHMSKKEVEQDKEELDKKIKEYNELEGKLSNETLGAEEFNQKLEKFLGYDEIKLIFDATEKGYKIYRNMKEEATNLSEGEKTAIAFIYFITKLKENGRRIEDSILVIDDPISSFDSNKLFSSYAYMKSECENAKQLFVLTHNYNFFSLVLGWFNKKHAKNPTTGEKIPTYSIYRIENRIELDKRIAILNDGGESLKQATEYDYVFYTVYSMRNKVLSKQESIFCGNVCRKLIESFLSFKFPKQRADLAALLQAALPGKENDIVREKIYKFVNVYSHEKKIDVFEELDTDILDASNQSVIDDILLMMQKLDKKHYDAMVEKVEGELS